MRGGRLLVAGLLAVALPGCRHADERAPVLALVAASTRDAVREAATLFEKDGGAPVTLNADDSSKLAMQISQGAPADLFLSANIRWADAVKEKGLAEDSTLLLGNALVLIVPKGNPAHVTGPAELTGAAVTHLAVAGPTVPAGIYAREALTKLKLWAALEPKAVIGENVRTTLAYVERGEAEAGIVYSTDAKISDRVEVVHTFADATHEPIRYALVLLRASRDRPAARRFYEFLQSPRAADVFRKYGFTRVPGN
jgi:molybdate transport system substrate-binding protein